MKELSKANYVVDPWMMDDPTQPKPAAILAAIIEFREEFEEHFRRVHERFDRIDRILDRIGRGTAATE